MLRHRNWQTDPLPKVETLVGNAANLTLQIRCQTDGAQLLTGAYTLQQSRNITRAAVRIRQQQIGTTPMVLKRIDNSDDNLFTRRLCCHLCIF
jgi:hypothetical protein